MNQYEEKVNDKVIDKEKEKKKNRIINAISIFIIISSFVIASTVLYVFVLKPQTIYNNAIEYFESGDYESAKLEFKRIEKFKDSSEKMALCDANMNKNNNQNTTTNAQEPSSKDVVNSAYYNIVKKFVDDLGEPKSQKDRFNNDFGTFEVTGVCLVKLIDFNNDGQDELVVGYNTNENKTMAYDVYAIIDNQPVQVMSQQPVEYRAQDCGYMSIEFYQKDGITYLYHWDSTAYLDSGYLMKFDGKEFITYLQWSATDDGYEFISDVIPSDKMPSEFPHFSFDSNQGTVNAKPINEYYHAQDGMQIYTVFFLNEEQAKALQNDVKENIALLKQSNDKVSSKGE